MNDWHHLLSNTFVSQSSSYYRELLLYYTAESILFIVILIRLVYIVVRGCHAY